MGGAVSEDLIYTGRESKQTAQETATWSDNSSICEQA